MSRARNLILFREGGLPTALSAADDEEMEGELVAMGIEDDTWRTGDGYKIPVGQMSSLFSVL